MEFTGQITHILEKEIVGQNDTPKQTIILEEVGSEYPNSIAIDFRKDKIELLTGKETGDVVNAKLNIKSREYNGRRYNSVNCWSLKLESKEEPKDDEVDSDLPF